MELGEKYLFALDRTVDPRDQREMVRLVRRDGIPFAGTHGNDGGPPFWKWMGLAEPDPASIPVSGREWLATQSQGMPTLSSWGYFARLDPNVGWIWHDHEASAVTKRLLAPVAGLFTKITKVNVILQVPGQRLPAHRDLVYGNSYLLDSPLHWRPGPQLLRYQGAPWVERVGPITSASHEENLFLCLKIPLSERPDDAGSPFVELAGRRHFYSSRNRMFFLNEVEMLHGGEPVPFWRGVVFVNGILNREEIGRVPKLPIEILRTSDVVG